MCYSHVAADALPKAVGISQIAEKSTHAAGDVYLAIMNEMLSLISSCHCFLVAEVGRIVHG